MSLRVFHVIFIIVCIALCAYVAVWGIREFLATRSNGAIAMTVVFLGAGAVLIAYSKRVFRKLGDL
jgi:archaellum biogenesis protein FlaJ (TadC family)